jgi:hypothetical protein
MTIAAAVFTKDIVTHPPSPHSNVRDYPLSTKSTYLFEDNKTVTSIFESMSLHSYVKEKHVAP